MDALMRKPKSSNDSGICFKKFTFYYNKDDRLGALWHFMVCGNPLITM